MDADCGLATSLVNYGARRETARSLAIIHTNYNNEIKRSIIGLLLLEARALCLF